MDVRFRSPTVTLTVPTLQCEKLAPYKPCLYGSSETTKETRRNYGLKEGPAFSHSLLKKGF